MSELDENQNQDADAQAQAEADAQAQAATGKPRGPKKREKGESLTVKEARKYVTTENVRGKGRLRHPVTGAVYTQNAPALGEGGPFSWIEAQVQAGLMKEYK